MQRAILFLRMLRILSNLIACSSAGQFLRLQKQHQKIQISRFHSTPAPPPPPSRHRGGSDDKITALSAATTLNKPADTYPPRIRSNGPRMSIQCPRPDPPACLLLLPFLLPPRTRVFLRELLKKNTTARRTAYAASKTVAARSLSMGAAQCLRRTDSRCLLRPNHPRPCLPKATRGPVGTTARYISTAGDTGPKPEVSSSSSGASEQEQGPSPTFDAFSSLEKKVTKYHQQTRNRYVVSQKNKRMKSMIEGDREIDREREEASQMETLIREEIEFAAGDWRDADVEEGHRHFWDLLREKPPAEAASIPKQISDLPDILPPFPDGPPPDSLGLRVIPARRKDGTAEEKSKGEGQSHAAKKSRKDASISYRTAPLDEFVLFAPPFTSPEDKEEYYALYTEKFLPPHLQLENTHPTPPVVQKVKPPEPHPGPWSLDMPYPSVFGVMGPESTGFGQDGSSTSEQMLQDLEAEWEARWTPAAYSRLLYTLEIAREDGVDVLCSLLLQRRQREVVWITKRIIDKRPDISNPDVKVWLQTSAAAEQENPKEPSMAEDIQQGMTFYTRDELDDISRRRRGVGILLSSLTSMLISGWKADQEITKTVFGALTMIDAPSNLDEKEEAQTASELFDSAFSHVLHSPAEALEDEEMEMTPQEIFSTVAQIIAYLHIEKHVPPIVYSTKHPRLHEMQSEIMRVISSDIEAAYGMELGLNMPRPDLGNARIDWGLWLELVNCIAAERGLGVSATWLMLRGADCISWSPLPGSPTDASAAPVPRHSLQDRKLVLPSYLVTQATSTMMFNSALDAWPPETPGRMLRLLKDISRITGPFDMDFARELLDHSEVNIHASYAEDIPKLPVKGKWDIDVYYSIIAGTCFRRDLTQTVRVWGEIERMLHGDAPILRVRRQPGEKLPPVEFAPDTAFEHPWYILAILIRHFRDRQRFDLVRYLVRSAIREGRLEKEPSFMNLMLQHAGDSSDHALAQFLLSRLEPPLARSTMTSVLHLHLRFGQQREAQAMLDFMKRNGIPADGVDLGIIARNTFKQSHKEGYALMDKAAARVKALQAVEAAPVTKPWSDGVAVPVVQKRPEDPIGPNAWFVVLLAALRDGNRDKATEALNALGINLDDETAASKMGIKIFNTLLASVCRREGSVQGMRMFKIYCMPDRQLLKQLDISLKSHRSGDRRLDRGTFRDSGRNAVGVKTRRLRPGEQYIPRPQDQRLHRDDIQERHRDGVIVPNVVTLRTVVHQALREKRDFNITRRILETLPMQPQQEAWMRHNAYFETEWGAVLDWAQGFWEMMDYGKDEWAALMSMKIIGPRTPRYKRPERVVPGDDQPSEVDVPLEFDGEVMDDEVLDDGLGEEEDEEDYDAVGVEDEEEEYPVNDDMDDGTAQSESGEEASHTDKELDAVDQASEGGHV
ncbi:hypothetical protein TWF696_001293 [Orbilia brochopaga]|uniref:Pentatricopeptide repeat protein n=1 Tax=Orbilia brochopaga TaxID=3140254 RepID=A0AAV9UBU4_9PEZI